MKKERWSIGDDRKTIIRNGQSVGRLDFAELAAEIVRVLNEHAPNDREAIADALGREANRVFNKSERDFPSNILDVVANNIRRGATENLTERT